MRFANLLLVPLLLASSACSAGTPPAAPTTPAPTIGGPAASALAPSAALAAPGPAALACTDDSVCGTHRCNVAVGKCAFPCAGDVDCVASASCVHGAVATCVAKP